ncbi:MAG: peptidylprolyl isomerase [Pyrinomonadaceae bacterium]
MKKQTILALLMLIALGLSAASGCSSVQNTVAQQQQHAAITQLSGEDLSLVLPKLAPPQALAQLAGNTQQIEVLLKQVKQVLAVAAEARKNGIADEPGVKQQLDFTATQVSAIEFDKDQNKTSSDSPTSPFSSVKPEEVEAFMTESGNEAKFNSFVEVIKKQIADASPAGVAPKEITTDQLKQFREQWAKALIVERKAKAAGFDKKHEVELQIALQQASLLAQEYFKRKDKEFDVDDAALNDYIAQHPEFDTTKQREKAEDVLRRAKAGEDFAKLANEFSEDPGNKDPKTGKPNGGLYADKKKGEFLPDFENAALALEKGQIAPNLVETPYGYHIIKLEDKKTTKDKDGKDSETFSVRHILISTAGAPDPSNPFAQPKNMRESARDKIKKEKRDKWIEEIEARNPITLPKPEEVKIEAPTLAPPSGMPNLPPTSGDTVPAPSPAAENK